MSKKHFVAIAATIRMNLNDAPTTAQAEGIERVAVELCHTFARFNGAFDRGRFLAACGVEP